jgi:hypothetical protein
LDKPGYVDLSKAAVDFADAVVKGHENISPELEEYIKQSGFVYHDGTDLIENPQNIMDVYKEILVEESVA